MEAANNPKISINQPHLNKTRPPEAQLKAEFHSVCIGPDSKNHLEVSISSLLKFVISTDFKNLSQSEEAVKNAAMKLQKYFCDSCEDSSEIEFERDFEKDQEASVPKNNLPEMKLLTNFGSDPVKAIANYIRYLQKSDQQIPASLSSTDSVTLSNWDDYQKIRARSISSQNTDQAKKIIEKRKVTAIVPVFQNQSPLHIYYKFLAHSMNSNIGELIEDLEHDQTSAYLSERYNRQIESGHRMAKDSGRLTIEKQINPLTNALFLSAQALNELDQALISESALTDPSLDSIRALRIAAQQS